MANLRTLKASGVAALCIVSLFFLVGALSSALWSNGAARPVRRGVSNETTELVEVAKSVKGERLKLMVVGTSNVAWGTWTDQLALDLTRAGFVLDTSGGTTSAMSKRCSDASELVVPTLRYARPGWYSWGFAFDGCDASVELAGVRVLCGDGWKCRRDESKSRLGPSSFKVDGVDVILLSLWQNDVWSRAACYNSSIPYEVLTVNAIGKLVHDLSSVNPRLRFVVMARYPYANGKRVSTHCRRENAYVRLGLAPLRNVVFADYDFPDDEDFYFSDVSGHPNCRGGRVMARAALDAIMRLEASRVARRA